jgi:GcrA cell cycle regulator
VDTDTDNNAELQRVINLLKGNPQPGFTHQAEQPNPAQPYLNDVQIFAQGGVFGTMQGRGINTPKILPDWVSNALNNPDNMLAIGGVQGERLNQLKQLLQAGNTYSEIADTLGISRGAVAGTVRDLNLKGMGNAPYGQGISQEARLPSADPWKWQPPPEDALRAMTPQQRGWVSRQAEAFKADPQTIDRQQRLYQGLVGRAVNQETDPVLQNIGQREYDMIKDARAAARQEPAIQPRIKRQPSMPQPNLPPAENVNPQDLAEFLRTFGPR